MKFIAGLICACFFAALVSCESDLITSATNTGTLEKKLVLNPSKAEWQQYDVCTLRARITNMPLDDVNFHWDLDDGQGFLNRSWFVQTIFLQNKVHNVRVKAFDAFTDVQLGYDSVRVDIRPPTPFVELTAFTSDTTLPMDAMGRMQAPLYFTLKTSTPVGLTKRIWHFDDGSDPLVDSSNASSFGRYFLHPGTLKVRVDVYERIGGLYIGSDTATVTLRMPTFNVESLSTFSMISAFLDVGATHPVTSDPLYNNPLAFVGLAQGGAVQKFTTTPTTFHGVYYREYMSNPNQIYYRLYDTVTAEFSEDHSMLRSVRVSVQDTGILVQGGINTGALRYTYTLKDLELLAVTSGEIVYRSASDAVNDFLVDLKFAATGSPNHPAGAYTGTGAVPTILQRKPGAFALIIFTR